MLAALLVLCTGGQTSPALDPIRYRIDHKAEVHIDLSGFGQPDQIQQSAFAWFLSITYADSAGGRTVHVVVDSAQADVPMLPLTTATFDSARGTVLHGWLSPAGRMDSLTVSSRSTLVLQLEAILRTMHPRLRPGAATGDRWTDTTEVQTTGPQGTQKTVTETNFTFGATEDRDGESVHRLEAAHSSTITAAVTTPAGPADMTGTATGTSTYLIGAGGRLLGGTSTAQGDLSLQLAMAPNPVPVRNSTETKLTLLK